MNAAVAEIGQRRLPLAARIFLLVVSILVLAMGAAILVSFQHGSQIAERAVRHALEASSAVQTEFAKRRLIDVQQQVQLIAADAAFVQYINDAQSGALAGAGNDAIADASSIFDLLQERQESYGFDLGMVLDPDANLLARTDEPEAFEQSLADDPFVKSAVETPQPISGFWRSENKVYQAAIWPLAQGQDLIGFLLVAVEVNDALGKQVRGVSDADVAYLIPVGERIEIIGASLEPALRAELQQRLDANAAGIANAVREGQSMAQFSLELAGGNWLGQLSPFDADGGPGVGTALQLTSVDQAEAGYRAILNAVAISGLIALLCALPLSLLLAKASLRPLAMMAKAANDAAAGNYQARLTMAGNDELAQLARAFDSLLSDLRGERDIESYVTHLSRLLPDPGEGEGEAAALPSSDAIAPPRGSAPRRAELSLVSIDTRQRLLPSAEQNADEALAMVGEFNSGVIAAAAEFGGDVLTSTGGRLLLGFAGEARRTAAVQFLREVLGSEPEIAAALIEGEVIAGSLHGDNVAFPAAVGVAAQQVERLQAESAPGLVLLPRNLGDALKETYGAEFVVVVKGALSGKPFYALNATTLATLPPSEPPATVDSGALSILRPITHFGRATSATGGGTDLPPGSRFGGRYKIISVLGTGGMGVVYKARDLELDDVVALKMLKGAALTDHDQLERLKSEIKLARRITHPNVLRTFDFGEHDGHPYISMEYVRGMTLRYLIKQSGRVPFTAALRIARQLGAGLQAAHEVGVLHRDIKPENLILEASGNAKLMDFGIARPARRGAAAGQTEPGMYVGTPAYSAPEQLAAQDVDHRADIYASGVLLCEMFCGQLPYAGTSTVEIYMAQMQATPLKPSAMWPEVPADLEAIILRCIERDPAARYQSAAALVADLAKLRA